MQQSYKIQILIWHAGKISDLEKTKKSDFIQKKSNREYSTNHLICVR